MMNCGVDIIEIERIKSAVEKSGRFLDEVFSKSEIEYFDVSGKRFETLAGFYAAKEAFAKLRKTGIRGFELREISVEHEALGSPYIVFRGERQKASLSISHNKTHATAVVCGEIGADFPKNQRMKELLPKRRSDANKGDCGRVFIIAGSEGMTGAAALCAKGALRSGAGLVTVGTAESERHIVACSVLEAMTVGLAAEDGRISGSAMKKILEYANKSDSVVFGPGLGQNRDMHSILYGLLTEYCGNLVIDADGLNALSKNCDILNEKRCNVIITPHPGEMSRLTGLSIGEIQQRRAAVAAEFSAKHGVCVLLKGEGTVVAKEGAEESYVNATGNPGMATGGTGDVLSGVIAAFMAQGLTPFDAAVLGAYIHGKAGDMGAEKYGIHGLTAGDVAEYVAFAIRDELR